MNDLDQYTKDGETSLVVELIDLYLENTARQISEIKSALENKKQEGLKQAAHALKGSSLTMGARGVGKICDQLERERVGSPLVAGLLVLLEREFASTAEIFKNERQKRLFPVAA